MADDVIGFGNDREPRSWSTRTKALLTAIGAAVLLVVSLVSHLPGGAKPVAHPAIHVAKAGPVQLAGLGSRAARLLNAPQPATAWDRSCCAAGLGRGSVASLLSP